MFAMNLCPTCRKMLYRTDACKGVGVECGRTDGGSKKLVSSSMVEHPPVKRTVVGSSPASSAKLTAALMEVPQVAQGLSGSAPDQQEQANDRGAVKVEAGTQAPPVDSGFPCHRCGGKNLHYANCPDAGAEVYPLDAIRIAPPVDTSRKRGRPSTGFDKKAYDREQSRKRRAKLKEGK